MRQIQSELVERGTHCVFLSADTIGQEGMFRTPGDFIYFLETRHGLGRVPYLTVFIDEFQHIPDAGMFLKNIFDFHKHHLQIIVSGSSSLEITKNTEFLTGRALDFLIDRVSFYDFFSYKQGVAAPLFDVHTFHEGEQFYRIFRADLDRYFLEYLTYGGYPEIITEPDVTRKKILLASLFDTYIQKDIIHFLRVENITAFNTLVRLLASQTGNLVNQSELANTLNIARPTLVKYIDILRGTYVYDFPTPYFTNMRKELSKMPKVFCDDLGLCNLAQMTIDTLSQQVDMGAIVENFVYLTLKHQDKKPQFYRTIGQSEIDFVVPLSDGRVDIFEVKYRSKITIPRNFSDFQKEYPTRHAMVVSRETFSSMGGVLILPAVMLPFIRMT